MTAPLRVLIVEDSPTDEKLVLHALRAIGRPIASRRVEDPEAMRDALTTEQFDLVISDWSLPKFSGLAALKILRDVDPDLPFILVSGTVGEHIAVEAMRAGAHDYALKNDLTRLGPAVERELREREIRAQRRRAEEALAAQGVRFQALIEHSADGITLVGRDRRTLYMSPAARRILGVPDGAPPPHRLADGIHPDDLERVGAAGEALRATHKATDTVECRIIRADGTVRWIELTRTNMLDDPAVGAIVANFRDVTERRRVLDALRTSEARFARLAESGIIGITIADIHGNMHEANDAALSMLGYTREEFETNHLSWADATPPEWAEVDARATARIVAEGGVPPWEKELLHKDGHRVPIMVGVAMLDYPFCIAIISDLTERKQAERALAETEGQLRHAQKMEAIGRLAGGIAHDFNNLLCVILSYAEINIDSLPPGDPVRDGLAEIYEAGRRAADLTKQLLMFSRRQVLEPKVLDLNAVVEGMGKMLRRLVGEDVDVSSVPSRPLGLVKADRGSIEQVIMNLVVNARDAMPAGGRITIEASDIELDEEFARAHVGTSPGPYVALAISDTGVGMDSTTLSRIFEPFFTTKEVGKGTGLGLSTVFGIIQLSGGAITVDSALGLGTTFKICLPRVDAAPPAERRTLERDGLRGSETILLVEDEDQVRVVARDILRRLGYAVIEARNGGEALLHCERDPRHIDLLLTDVVMPQMSGPELAERLAQVKPGLKLLCMSGYTDDSTLRHGVLESSMAFLQKPITPDSLGRKVREVLDAPARPT